jgi:hypothetical protein
MYFIFRVLKKMLGKLIVMDSQIRRKLMLLNHRLRTLKGKRVGNGVLDIGAGSKAPWTLTDDKGFERSLFPAAALEGYASSANKFNNSIMDPIEEVVCWLFPGDWPSSEPIRDRGISVLEFGELLGLEKPHSRYIIDKHYAANFPMFSALEQSNNAALKFCESFAGCFCLYRYDINQEVNFKRFPNGILIRASLSVRYPVPQKPFFADGKGGSSIRTKLNVPSYRDKGFSLYEYDGLVGIKTGRKITKKKSHKKWWTWLFQGRFGDEFKHIEDFILMYTEAFTDENQRWAQGMMLTQNQDNYNTPTHSYIVLHREPGYTLVQQEGECESPYFFVSPDEKEFMGSQVASINPVEPNGLCDRDQEALARLIHCAKRGTPFF